MARKKVMKIEERANIVGAKLKALRQTIHPRFSQKDLADQLQLLGVDVGKNQVQEIESGVRKISDKELKGLAKFFNTTTDELLKEEDD